MENDEINKQAFIACERKNLAPDGFHYHESWLDGKTNFEYEKQRIKRELAGQAVPRQTDG